MAHDQLSMSTNNLIVGAADLPTGYTDGLFIKAPRSAWADFQTIRELYWSSFSPSKRALSKSSPADDAGLE